MELRTEVAAFLIWVIVYQVTNSNCMPRRYKNNCSNKSLNMLHKAEKIYQSNNRQAPTGNTYYKPKSPVNENLRKNPDVIPNFEKNFDLANYCIKSPPPVKSYCFDIPEVPELEKDLDLSKICIKSPPAFEKSWDIPEVPNFENHLDFSKLCINLPSVKSGSSSVVSNLFNPYGSSYGPKKTIFPEVQYPLDVNDFRLPIHWDEYIEQKLKQQEKEINEVCKDFYVGNSRARPKAKDEAIEKAVNALIKSQSMNKGSQSECISFTTTTKTQGGSRINSQPEIKTSKSGSVMPVIDEIKSTKTIKNVILSSTSDTCETNVLDLVSPTLIDNIETPQGNQIPTQDLTVSQPMNNIVASSIDKEASTISDKVIVTEEILPQNSSPAPVNKPISKCQLTVPDYLRPVPINEVSLILSDTTSTTDCSTPEKKETSPPVDVPPSSPVWEIPIGETGSTLLLAEIMSDTLLPTSDSRIPPVDLPKDSLEPVPCNSLSLTSLPNSLTTYDLSCDSFPTNGLPIASEDLPEDTLVPLLSEALSNTPLPIAPTDVLKNTFLAPAVLPTDNLAPLPNESLLDKPLLINELPLAPFTPIPTEILSDTHLPNLSSIAPAELPTETLVSNTPVNDDVVFNEDDGLVTLSPFLDEARVIRSCPGFSPDFLSPGDIDYFIV